MCVIRKLMRRHAHPGEVLRVPQKYSPLLGDAVAVIELDQLVQR